MSTEDLGLPELPVRSTRASPVSQYAKAPLPILKTKVQLWLNVKLEWTLISDQSSLSVAHILTTPNIAFRNGSGKGPIQKGWLQKLIIKSASYSFPKLLSPASQECITSC